MARLFPHALLFVVLTSVAALSCGGSPAPPPKVAVDLGGDAHPADAVPAARHLPHAMQVLAVTDNLSQLLDKAGRGEIIANFRQDYERMAFELVREVGYNVLSPEAVADLGVDVEGQAGVALYAENSPTPSVIGFLTLDNPERFKNLIYMIAHGRVGRMRLGMHASDNGVAVGRREMGIALVDNTAILVFGGDAFKIAQRLVELQPEESLAQHRPFRIAMREGAGDATVRGYFDLRAAIYAQARLDPRWSGTTLAEAKADIERLHRRVLAGARTRGASIEEIRAIDERYEPLHAALRDDKFDQRMRKLFGGIGGGGFTLSVSDRGLEMKAHVDLTDESLLGRLFRDRKGPPPLVGGLTEVPSGMLGVSLDLGVLAQLARELDAPITEANILAGGDIETELLPLFTGDIAIAGRAPTESLASLDNTDKLQLTMLVGVADAAKVETIISRFTDKGEGRAPITAAGPRSWKLKLDDTPELSLTLTDAHLVVSTDAGAAARVAKGGRNARGPRAYNLATTRHTAGEFYMEMAALFATTMVVFRDAPERAVRVPWHDPAVKKSTAYEAKLAAIRQVELDIHRLRQAQQQRSQLALISAAEELGATGGHLKRSEHGLSMVASYRTSGRSVASIVRGLKRLSDTDAPHEDDARRAELEAKREQLLAELDAIYDALAPKKPKTGAAPVRKAVPKKSAP